MPTPKAAIKEVLESLDHKNDALWTDDGSPLVTEVQRLANDKTITRAQINDALPGFARKTTDSVSEDEQPSDEVVEDEGSGGITAAGPKMDAPVEPTEEELADLSPEQERARLKGLAHQRVLDAEIALSKARQGVSEAQHRVMEAEQRHARALQIYSSKYPPMSPEEAIKLHLIRQQEIKRERMTGFKAERNSAYCPADIALMDRKRNNGRKGIPVAPYIPHKATVSY